MHRCHFCERSVPAALRFCPVCGTDLRARPTQDVSVPAPPMAEVMPLIAAPAPARPARRKRWLPDRRLTSIIGGMVLTILLVVVGLIAVSLFLEKRQQLAMDAVSQTVRLASATAIDIAAARTADARLMATLTAVALARATPTATPFPSPSATMTPVATPSPSPTSPATVTPTLTLMTTVIPSYTPTVLMIPTTILTPTEAPTVVAVLTSSPSPTPSPSPATAVSPPTPVPRAFVNVSGLIVRSGPNTKSAILGTVRKGDELYIMGQNTAGNWLLVCCLAEQQPGWVFAEYVNIVGDLEAVPIVPEE